MAVAQEQRIEWLEPDEKEHKLRLKRRRQARQVRRHLVKWQSILFLSVIVTLTASLAAATIHLTVVQGAEVRGLESEIADLKGSRDKLRMEADGLRAVSRIEFEALAMGMEKPVGTVYVTSTLPPLNSLPSLQDQAAIVLLEPPPVMPTAAETTLDRVKGFARTFTSFFASTQR